MDNQLNKKERYLLKRQEKEQAFFKKNRQRKIRKIVNISLVVIIFGSIAFLSVSYFLNREKVSDYGTPQIVFSSKEYNAGTVSISSGLVQNTHEIKNEGDGDLKIDSIWTSCMCTTARLRVGDEVSPEFGMHTQSSLWSEIIHPGEIGYLDVTFDPAFHGPEGTGSMVRTIYLTTNDSENEQAQVQMLINVVK